MKKVISFTVAICLMLGIWAFFGLTARADTVDGNGDTTEITENLTGSTTEENTTEEPATDVPTDVPTEAPKPKGWIKESGKWYFYRDNGTLKTGWQKYDDNWYYLSSDGSMKTLWLKDDGSWYYLGKSGKMTVGWKKIDGSWYFFDIFGKMKTEWLKDDGSWYYLDKSGKMNVNWKKIDGYWYFFDKNGKMKTGWLKDSDWYYLRSSGRMACGFVKIGEKTAYLNPNGKYITQWNTADEYVSVKEINKAAKTYSLSKNTKAFYAVCLINSKYADRLSSEAKKGTALFLFEGAGKTSDISVRKNALCVLVRNGRIIYMNKCCSTIPDCPFDPARNYDTPMPTLKSGIYNFKTVYHSSATTQCAGLNVIGAKVVRHRNQTDYYSSTSDSINIHRRNRDFVAKDASEQISSAGCLLIGNSGKKSTDEYAGYSAILGITDEGDSGTASCKHYISGKVIVDRTYAADYLRSIGYSDGAIALIG